MLAMLLDSTGTLCISTRSPSGLLSPVGCGSFQTRLAGLVINLVSEDTHGECLVDSLVEAGKQLKQAFTTAANQHVIGTVFIRGGGDTTHLADRADGDLAVFDQFRDAGQRVASHETLCLGGLLSLSRVLAG